MSDTKQTEKKQKSNPFTRFFRYYLARAVREKGSPHKIATGWALGVCIGFAVPFGFQLAVSIPLSFLLRCSKVGATVGTFVTNHFSIFIIYPFQTWLGNRILCGDLTLREMETVLKEVFEKQDYATLFNLGIEITVSFLLGGVVLALISTPIAYYAVRALVVQYRRKSEQRKKRKKQKGKVLHADGTKDHHIR